MWKLKREDLLEERDQWLFFCNEIRKPTKMLDKDWAKLDKKE
jgi:hypothetical protein